MGGRGGGYSNLLHTPVIMSLHNTCMPTESHSWDNGSAFMGTVLLDAFAEDGTSGRFVEVLKVSELESYHILCKSYIRYFQAGSKQMNIK